MGLTSWLIWLGDKVDKLETVLSMTKDEEQRKLLEEVISEMKSKAKE